MNTISKYVSYTQTFPSFLLLHLFLLKYVASKASRASMISVTVNKLLLFAIHNYHINVLYKSALVIRTNNIPLMFISSLGSIQPQLLWPSDGVSIHNINLYPRMYPFIPMGEEKQL